MYVSYHSVISFLTVHSWDILHICATRNVQSIHTIQKSVVNYTHNIGFHKMHDESYKYNNKWKAGRILYVKVQKHAIINNFRNTVTTKVRNMVFFSLDGGLVIWKRQTEIFQGTGSILLLTRRIITECLPYNSSFHFTYRFYTLCSLRDKFLQST